MRHDSLIKPEGDRDRAWAGMAACDSLSLSLSLSLDGADRAHWYKKIVFLSPRYGRESSLFQKSIPREKWYRRNELNVCITHSKQI